VADMRLLQRLCPHGWWSYSIYRRYRTCWVCGLQQREIGHDPVLTEIRDMLGVVNAYEVWIDA
jgi:hypothetical protein